MTARNENQAEAVKLETPAEIMHVLIEADNAMRLSESYVPYNHVGEKLVAARKRIAWAVEASVNGAAPASGQGVDGDPMDLQPEPHPPHRCCDCAGCKAYFDEVQAGSASRAEPVRQILSPGSLLWVDVDQATYDSITDAIDKRILYRAPPAPQPTNAAMPAQQADSGDAEPMIYKGLCVPAVIEMAAVYVETGKISSILADQLRVISPLVSRCAAMSPKRGGG